MKLSSLAVLAAVGVVALVSPATVSAFECTAEEANVLQTLDYTALDEKCPSIFVDETGFDPTDISTITAETIKAISSCKSQFACLDQLSATRIIIGHCFYNGINYWEMYYAYNELCAMLGYTNVTVAQARELFQGVVISETGGDGDTGDNGDETAGEADSTTTTEEPETEKPETEAPATKAPVTKAPATEETPATTKPDTSVAATTSPPTLAPTPVPTPPPTSGSSASTIVGVTVVTTATLVASLLL